MSTKCSMFFDEKLHFYQEVFDESNVYLEISEEKTNVKYKFTLQQILSIVQCVDYEKMKKQASLTDEQIKNHVESVVKTRMATGCTLSKLSGSLIYGFADEPKEQQIEKAVNYFKEKRNKLKNIFEMIESGRRLWSFQSGLEEIV